ncbi:tautomerase family protein [Streptomyces sp. NPDC046977]|uniref:tautomerase family protein n=1 Tax=Streptomyces sp. NPDC046977 TaxID=3154703 RepID=UPI0033D9C1A2
MPVYHVVTTENTVPAAQKAALAAEITRLHASITGAPTSFVHVTFAELPEGSVFTDAAPSRPLLIEATTRAGHADAEKTRLAREISAAGSRLTGVPESHILVIIKDSPARFAAEGGRILPEPGDEGDWIAESG